ncbi:hypothetical protein Q3G72_015706 [Acer saccharum]|nr:hypothetical protein Q3G72_015706 [Acer saccharum]
MSSATAGAVNIIMMWLALHMFGPGPFSWPKLKNGPTTAKKKASKRLIQEAVPGGGRELKHDQEWVFDTDRNFRDIGRIWARTNCKLDRSENHEGDLIAEIPSWRSIYGEDGVGEGSGEHGIQCEAREVRRSCENQDNTGKRQNIWWRKSPLSSRKDPLTRRQFQCSKLKSLALLLSFVLDWFFFVVVDFCLTLEIEDEGLRDAEGKGSVGSVPGVSIVVGF